jgi:L-alanine-DL-glutamate epimerase-like enolase superfamily enzyme
VYDAYGKLHQQPVWSTLNEEYMNGDLGQYLQPAFEAGVDFRGRYPADYIASIPKSSLISWHLVGGLDPVDVGEINGHDPVDGHPVLLADWIERDGLKCLKVKLRGNDSDWDYQRLVRVGRIGRTNGVHSLTADFNCTVTDPQYVIAVLDRLLREEPQIYEDLLYIEQPFPYDLESHLIDVREVSRRKPLLMDESAHNWELIRLGRSLGWTGVALKTCKTLTGALLSHCWAKSHGMHVMVQDLTNPMLAQIPHLQLAAYTDTMMGVETNAMQFYPSASDYEAKVHPGCYQRVHGKVDLTTTRGPGFGYRVDEIARPLPAPTALFDRTTASSNRVSTPHLKMPSHVRTEG